MTSSPMWGVGEQPHHPAHVRHELVQVFGDEQLEQGLGNEQLEQGLGKEQLD